MPPAERDRAVRFPRRAGSIVLVISIVGLALALLGLRTRLLRRLGASGRPSVAVLGFQNLSGKPENVWLSTALAEMLSADLAAGEKIRTAPSESVARLKADLPLPDADSLSRETLARVSRSLGTGVVVLGSFVVIGDRPATKVRLDVRMQDTATGDTLATSTQTGGEGELFSLVSRAGARLREKLGAGGLTADESARVRASLPADAEAARLYAEGLARLRRFDAVASRDLLRRSVGKEPGFPLSHSALAEALSRLGDDGQAREESRKAIDLAAVLPREEKLLVEGRAHDAASEKAEAVESYRSLVALFPDSLEYGLLLAGAQTAAGSPKDALATVGALRALPEPERGDPRIDLAEAQAAEGLSDLPRALGALETASRKAEAAGSRLILARCLALQGYVLETRGEPKRALASLAKAKELFRASGDLGGVATSLRTVGQIEMQAENFDAAAAALGEALATRREIGDRMGAAQTLNALAAVSKKRGDLPMALAHFRGAYDGFKEVGSKRGMAMTLHNIGATLFDLADYDGSLKSNQEALALRREIGNKRGIALDLANLVNDFRDRGDLAGARRSAEESLAIAREIGAKDQIGTELLDFAILLADADDLVSALAKARESVAVFEQSGDKPELEQSRMNEMMTLVELGRPKEAEGAIQAARDASRASKLPAREMLLDVRLAECLLRQERVAEARDAVAESMRLSLGSEDRRDRFELALVAVRVAAAERSRSLDPGLRGVLEEAETKGVFREKLEARLALAEWRARTGDASAAKRLQEVEADARRRGFLLLARKAAAARSGRIL